MDNGDLLKRLERAEREIDIQKKRVRELEGHLKHSRNEEPLADRKPDLSIHSRFVERVQQMMESIDGSPGSSSLQELWRRLKNKMELYQESRHVIKRLHTFIIDKELVRTEEIIRILEGKRD